MRRSDTFGVFGDRHCPSFGNDCICAPSLDTANRFSRHQEAAATAGSRLIPFDIELPLKLSYYVVQEQGEPDEHADAFRDRVIGEAAAG